MNPQKLKIINIGPEESGRKLIEQLGSSYGNSEVRINLNLYDHAGVGIPERQYYGIDTNKTLVLKPKSVANSLFHEFTHCLHKVENSILYEYYRKHSQKKDQIWSDYEEQRTIAGYFPTGIYDPICENCFNLYDTIVSKTAYIPRIGHWAYMGRDEKKTMLQLSDIYGKLLFKLEWTTIYI
jgi:hypothetical protein